MRRQQAHSGHEKGGGCHTLLTLAREDMRNHPRGDAMNTHETELDHQADLLAEAALHELGDTLLDDPDEYAEQCDDVGGYPWLEALVCAHPHDRPLASITRDTPCLDPDIYG
jgi:hypothetical protein